MKRWFAPAGAALAGAALVGVALAGAPGPAFAEEGCGRRDVDLHIFDARILDGTGAPAVRGEIHVRDDRIVHGWDGTC